MRYTGKNNGNEQWLKVAITGLKLTNEKKKGFFQVNGTELGKKIGKDRR